MKQAPGKQVFNAKIEAFLVMLVDNCYTKWQNIPKWMAENPGMQVPRRTKDNAKETEILATKYTDFASGQMKVSAWGQGEAYDKWCDLVIAIQKSREDPAKIEALEEAFLVKYREEKGIKEKTPPAKKRKKGQKSKPSPKKPRIDIDFSDLC